MYNIKWCCRENAFQVVCELRILSIRCSQKFGGGQLGICFSFFTFVKILSNQQVFSFLSFSVFKRFLKLLYSLWRFLCFFLYLEGTDNNNNERQVNSKSTTRDIN
jgi:hypothetical protein